MGTGPNNLFRPKNAHVRSATTNEQTNGNIINCKTFPDMGGMKANSVKSGKVKVEKLGPGKKII